MAGRGSAEPGHFLVVSSSLDKLFMNSSFLARRRSSLRLRASFVLVRRASAWSLWDGQRIRCWYSVQIHSISAGFLYYFSIGRPPHTREIKSATAHHKCESKFTPNLFWDHNLVHFTRPQHTHTIDSNLRQKLLAGLVSLQLVNVLHENALVLEHITLGPQVEAVVPAAQAENSHEEQFQSHNMIIMQEHWRFTHAFSEFRRQLSLTGFWMYMLQKWAASTEKCCETYMCLSIFLDSL